MNIGAKTILRNLCQNLLNTNYFKYLLYMDYRILNAFFLIRLNIQEGKDHQSF